MSKIDGYTSTSMETHSLEDIMRTDLQPQKPSTTLSKAGRFILTIMKEFGAIFALACIRPLNLAKRNIHQKPSGSTPILFVHGYLGSSSHWTYHWNRLEKAGCGPMYAVNLGYPFKSIEDHSKIVENVHKEIISATGKTDLILVGHSMGGIVGAWYATHCRFGRVRQVYSIGSPLDGTKMAFLGVGDCCKQMRYKSEFIKSLNEKMKAAVDTKFFHVGSQADMIIRPAESALSGIPESNKFWLKQFGHASLLFSPEVSNFLIQYIKRA
jgi:triacylglycerol lipase